MANAIASALGLRPSGVTGQHALAAVEAAREHSVWWPKVRLRLAPYAQVSRADMGDAAFAAAWTQGRTMTLAAALAPREG